jgi:23S rRNA-/tRNA-specific pseudouridylate synthase
MPLNFRRLDRNTSGLMQYSSEEPEGGKLTIINFYFCLFYLLEIRFDTGRINKIRVHILGIRLQESH